jgi:truncated hemoglobin YjbI
MDHSARPDSLTPEQRAMYGRMGAAIARARHNPTELTAEARKRFLSRFEEQARELHPDADDLEIARVAKELKRAHFIKLAIASSRARGRKALRDAA